MNAFKGWLKEASTQKMLNAWMSIFWLGFAVVGVFTFLKDSLQVLFFISVYANAAGHLSAWQSAKIEVKEEQAEESAHMKPKPKRKAVKK